LERPPARFAAQREGFGQQVFERLALGQTLLELGRPGGEVGVGKLLHGGLERVDLVHATLEPLTLPLVLRPDDLPQRDLYVISHRVLSSRQRPAVTCQSPAETRSVRPQFDHLPLITVLLYPPAYRFGKTCRGLVVSQFAVAALNERRNN